MHYKSLLIVFLFSSSGRDTRVIPVTLINQLVYLERWSHLFMSTIHQAARILEIWWHTLHFIIPVKKTTHVILKSIVRSGNSRMSTKTRSFWKSCKIMVPWQFCQIQGKKKNTKTLGRKRAIKLQSKEKKHYTYKRVVKSQVYLLSLIGKWMWCLHVRNW